MQNNLYSKFGKRIFDFLCALIGFTLLLPIFLFISLLIKIGSKGPIFFVQKRVGLYLKEFDLYKFRSMIVEAPKLGLAITSGNDPRITPLGKFIRKYKLDELPQLINVIKGDMSLVGSRPEVKKYVEYYKNDYEKILKARPGITDLASIKYRDENSLLTNIEDKEKYYLENILKDKIKLNLLYLKKMNFIFDLSLIFKTIFSSEKPELFEE